MQPRIGCRPGDGADPGGHVGEHLVTALHTRWCYSDWPAVSRSIVTGDKLLTYFQLVAGRAVNRCRRPATISLKSGHGEIHLLFGC